jgi:hypothetical protein
MIWPSKIDRAARITTTIGVIGMVWVLCGPYASLRISRMEYFNQFLGELKGSTVTYEDKVAASIGLWLAFAVVPIWALYLVIPRAKGKERIASNHPERTRIFLRRPHADEWTNMAVPAAVILLSALSDAMMWLTLFILPFLMIASGLSFVSLLASVAIPKDRKAMNLSGVCWVLIFFAITWCVFSLDVYKHASKHP